MVKKIIRAGRDEVFEAFTNPEIMTKWFFAGEDWTVDVSNVLRNGGSYRISMHVPDGKTHTMVGEYREITVPEKLVFTWNSEHVRNTIVTVTFRDLEGATEVAIIHELLPTEEMRNDHRRGWSGCLNNLDKLFA